MVLRVKANKPKKQTGEVEKTPVLARKTAFSSATTALQTQKRNDNDVSAAVAAFEDDIVDINTQRSFLLSLNMYKGSLEEAEDDVRQDGDIVNDGDDEYYAEDVGSSEEGGDLIRFLSQVSFDESKNEVYAVPGRSELVQTYQGERKLVRLNRQLEVVEKEASELAAKERETELARKLHEQIQAKKRKEIADRALQKVMEKAASKTDKEAAKEESVDRKVVEVKGVNTSEEAKVSVSDASKIILETKEALVDRQNGETHGVKKPGDISEAKKMRQEKEVLRIIDIASDVPKVASSKTTAPITSAESKTKRGKVDVRETIESQATKYYASYDFARNSPKQATIQKAKTTDWKHTEPLLVKTVMELAAKKAEEATTSTEGKSKNVTEPLLVQVKRMSEKVDEKQEVKAEGEENKTTEKYSLDKAVTPEDLELAVPTKKTTIMHGNSGEVDTSGITSNGKNQATPSSSTERVRKEQNERGSQCKKLQAPSTAIPNYDLENVWENTKTDKIECNEGSRPAVQDEDKMLPKEPSQSETGIESESKNPFLEKEDDDSSIMSIASSISEALTIGMMSFFGTETQEMLAQAKDVRKRKKANELAKREKEDEEKRKALEEEKRRQETMAIKKQEAEQMLALAQNELDDDVMSRDIFSVDSVADSFMDGDAATVYSGVAKDAKELRIHVIKKAQEKSGPYAKLEGKKRDDNFVAQIERKSPKKPQSKGMRKWFKAFRR